jgi:hypothetical protein
MLPEWFRGLMFCVSLGLAGCGGGSNGGADSADGQSHALGAKPPALVSVTLQSEPGDYIGAGGNYSYTKADAVISVSYDRGVISISVAGDEDWSGSFQVPGSPDRLRNGSYTGLVRYPFNDPAKGGLAWSGEGRGCNSLVGSFSVDKVVYAAGLLKSVELSFEQYCDGAAAPLRGQVHWTTQDTTAPPGPVNPPPAELWTPADGTTPASGRYVYLQSDAGDYIGQGQTYLYTPADATLSASTNGGLFQVSVSGPARWTGEFKAMSELTQLQPGYYGDLQRYPFHNQTKGGLSWSGEGRGCNTLTGWFVVDQVSYVGGALDSIKLRFEQHCDGGTPALRGEINWTP